MCAMQTWHVVGRTNGHCMLQTVHHSTFMINWYLSLANVICAQCRLGMWWCAQQGWAACRSCRRAWEADWELPFCPVWKLVPPRHMQPGCGLWVCSRHWWSQVRENKCTSVMLYRCTMIHWVCSQHRCSQVTTTITVTNTYLIFIYYK